MKKIAIISFLIIIAFQVKCQSIGDFRSISDGNWNNSSIWEVFSGSSWNSTSQIPELQFNNIYVYHNIILSSNLELKSSLVIEAGSVSIGENTLKINNNLTINNGQLNGGMNSSLEINAFSTIVEIPQITLNSLIINSPLGLNIEGDLTINNELNLQNGILNIGDHNLILRADALVKGNFSETTMISGGNNSIIRKYTNGVSNYFFPIGSLGTNNKYTPLELNFKNGDFCAASYVEVGVSSLKQLDVSIFTTSYLKRFWTINASGISNFNCELTFQYSEEDVIGTENEILCMEVKNGDFTKGSFVNTLSNQMSISTTEFGQYTGSSTNWVLGCELLNFDATIKDHSVSLNWSTASENDTKEFEIEQSIDALNFHLAGTIAAAGNSNELRYYNFNDNNTILGKNILYYRLKTIDNNGAINYSKIIKVNPREKEFGYSAIYSKSDNKIILNYNSDTESNIRIDITGLNGRIILTKEFEVTEGPNKIGIDADFFETGIFIVSVDQFKEYSSTKLLVY
jgi:hypothetical protein